MKLGINSYTLMWAIGFKGPNPAYPDHEARPENPLRAGDLLEIARQYHLGLVQTGPNLDFDSYPAAEQEDFIQKARAYGIQLELGTRGLDTAHLLTQILLAKRMGAKLIRTLPEVGGKYAVDAHLILPVIRQILPVLEREGIQLAIENGRTPAADLRAVLDEIHSPYVGVVLDMVNSLAVPEGWKEVTRLLAPHTMCVHYKDFTITRAWHMMGFICQGTPAGKGMVELPWLMETLRASPYDFNVLIELWPPEQETLEKTILLEQEWLEESISFMRSYITS
jgi:3-oxoisoapionate decarboxylase